VGWRGDVGFGSAGFQPADLRRLGKRRKGLLERSEGKARRAERAGARSPIAGFQPAARAKDSCVLISGASADYQSVIGSLGLAGVAVAWLRQSVWPVRKGLK